MAECSSGNKPKQKDDRQTEFSDNWTHQILAQIWPDSSVRRGKPLLNVVSFSFGFLVVCADSKSPKKNFETQVGSDALRCVWVFSLFLLFLYFLGCVMVAKLFREMEIDLLLTESFSFRERGIKLLCRGCDPLPRSSSYYRELIACSAWPRRQQVKE